MRDKVSKFRGRGIVSGGESLSEKSSWIGKFASDEKSSAEVPQFSTRRGEKFRKFACCPEVFREELKMLKMKKFISAEKFRGEQV